MVSTVQVRPLSGQKFRPKIQKFRPKIQTKNLGQKFRPKIQAKNFRPKIQKSRCLAYQVTNNGLFTYNGLFTNICNLHI
jgi:hypothetical protein